MIEDEKICAFAQEHVVRAAALLSLLMPQTSGVGIGVKGLDGRYQLANQAMAKLIDRSVENIAGKTDAELFPPELADQLQRSDRQVGDGAASASDELRFSLQGRPLHCLWLKFPVLDPDGAIKAIAAVMLDMTRQDAVAEMRLAMERLHQTNQELQKALLRLDRLASSDVLTGAWNRRRLEEAVSNEMDRLKRYDHPLCLLVIDIDWFKCINDEHGHAVGDQVLTELTAVIQSTLRASDSLTRWGGEEFVVLCPNTTLSTVAMLAERLRERIAKASFPAVDTMTVSIGAAECISGETWEDWFKRADAALYRAKACGRNQVQIAPETPQRLGVGENVSANFVQLVWHPAYECGQPLIDDQHRLLFADANKLLAAILSGRPAEEVTVEIDALVRDVLQHFNDEEAIIRAAGYPDAVAHAEIHRGLIDNAVTLVARFHAGNLAIGELFQFLAHDIVARHMLGADREFFPYLAMPIKLDGQGQVKIPTINSCATNEGKA